MMTMIKMILSHFRSSVDSSDSNVTHGLTERHKDMMRRLLLLAGGVITGLITAVGICVKTDRHSRSEWAQIYVLVITYYCSLLTVTVTGELSLTNE